jgi:putative effector of murein hydrolase LrgA (UPF0299 family)
MNNRTVLIFTILLACQLAGEVLALALQLPVPGPVVGMVLLFCGLLIYGRVPQPMAAVTGELLQNLSLLFVPAGVGVMLHAQLLADNWLALSLGLVLSTIIALAVTGAAMNWAARWTARRAKEADVP